MEGIGKKEVIAIIIIAIFAAVALLCINLLIKDSARAANAILSLSALLVFGTLIALFIQSRQTAKATRSEAYDSIFAQSRAVNELIIDGDKYELLYQWPTHENKRKRRDWLILILWDFYEYLFRQKELGLIDEDGWQRWQRGIIATLRMPVFRKMYWDKGLPEKYYSAKFTKYINKEVLPLAKQATEGEDTSTKN